MENASYGLSVCAEVAALCAANTAGDFNLKTIAIFGWRVASPTDATVIVTPCGRCRQLIFEAAQQSIENETDIKVLSCNADLSIIDSYGINELLPEAFGPNNLGIDQNWAKNNGLSTAKYREALNCTEHISKGESSAADSNS